MKPFRLKDKTTGLYYCPSRTIQVKHESGQMSRVKSNLSKKGKIYFTDPRKHISGFYDHTQVSWTKEWNGSFYRAKPLLRPKNDWIIEYL